MREQWLHGWIRGGRHNGEVRNQCAGCGTSFGVGCIVVDPNQETPPTPDWPFESEDCPLCKFRNEVIDLKAQLRDRKDKLTERLERLAKKNS